MVQHFGINLSELKNDTQAPFDSTEVTDYSLGLAELAGQLASIGVDRLRFWQQMVLQSVLTQQQLRTSTAIARVLPGVDMTAEHQE